MARTCAERSVSPARTAPTGTRATILAEATMRRTATRAMGAARTVSDVVGVAKSGGPPVATSRVVENSEVERLGEVERSAAQFGPLGCRRDGGAASARTPRITCRVLPLCPHVPPRCLLARPRLLEVQRQGWHSAASSVDCTAAAHRRPVLRWLHFLRRFFQSFFQSRLGKQCLRGSPIQPMWPRETRRPKSQCVTRRKVDEYV